MSELIEAVRSRLPAGGPAVIGIGGAVAVGKSTVAATVAEALVARVVSTDAFLLTNAQLAERDLALRKGFPESYDASLIVETFERIRAGGDVFLPVYSHEVYDIVEGATEHLTDIGIVIVEGVVALQEPVRAYLDVAIYIDAPAHVVRGWFVDRFVRWTLEAAEATFYHGFRHMPADEVRHIAEMTWDAINAVNLREHIAPSRASADIVVTKAPDHTIAEVITIGS